MSVSISWNRRKISIPLTNLITLFDLQAEIAQQTLVPIERQKLLFSGIQLKDPKASLASYGIRNGSSLMLMGRAIIADDEDIPTAPTIPPKAYGSSSEDNAEKIALSNLNQIITEAMERSTTYYNQYISLTEEFLDEAFDTSNRELELSYLKASEYLMQSLLKIDGLEAPFESCKLRRKEAVKRVQAMMDEIDGLKKKVDSILAGGSNDD